MNKADLLKRISKGLSGNPVDFSAFDLEVEKLKKSLQETVNLQTLDDVSRKLKQFQNKIDFTPLLTEIETIRNLFAQGVKELETKIEEKSQALIQASEEKNVSRVTAIGEEISNLKAELAKANQAESLQVLNKTLTEVQNAQTLFGNKLTSLSSDLKTYSTSAETKILRDSLENLRTDLLTRLGKIGGGSMNRQIFIGGTNPLTKYTDINLKAGSNVTLTSANNDTTKQVDVTIASSGGGSSPLTTKGDIYVYSTTNDRLPVGSNTQVLSADSSQATGLKWVAAGAGTGTVTTVGSADATVTITNPTTTPDLSVAKAPILSTARTIAGVSFNGSANIAIPASGLSNGVTGSGAVVLAGSPALTGTPTAPTPAQADNSTTIATTAYVDQAVLGQNFKEAVRVATTAALVGVYNNGSSGVGATFIYTATGTDVIDGVTLALNDRVLVKNQGASDLQNGIYTVTTAGAIGVAGILTRATDANQSAEYKTGDSVFVTAGTTQTSTTWAYTGIDSPTMGTTSLTYVQVAGQGSFTGGTGITITGTSIAVTAPVTVALGGTNATSAGITAFNNITGYTAAGATGTTSTNLVFSTSPTLVTPVLGTPTSGTLTNCTGLPVAGITASTTTALGVGSIELGHATDTTLSRSSAGVLAVEGVVIPSISSTNTITNKWNQPRFITTTQSATPSINTDNGDIFDITALAQAITSMTTNLTGTPVAGQKIMIEITDNATARAITWGASFAATTVPLPTTTVISTRLRTLFEWSTVTSKWECIATA